jgi:tRNA(Ile)-lysidine synthase
MLRRARSRREEFGPAWLNGRLSQLLPQFPRVRLCVAFSGGADSTALLAALASLPHPPLALRALHINHGLQPAAAQWGRHCRHVAAALGVRCTVRRVAIARGRGESLEAAARTQRYRLLGAQLRAGEVLLTAHHLDDQCETLLLQLLRGAGLAGLAAMPARAPLARGLLLRPLLEVPAAALRTWLSSRGLPWIEDDSNAELHFDRNYLRLRVLPPLRARWPAAAATVARAAGHIAEAQQLLDALAASDLLHARHGRELEVAALRALDGPRRRNALRSWLSAAGVRPPSASILGELAGALLAARADAQPSVTWHGAHVERRAGRLSVRRAGSGRPRPLAQETAALVWRWRRRRHCRLPSGAGSLSLHADAAGPLDLDALGAALQIRARAGGERLRPLRGGPRRTLKQLLQEARVPLALRAQVPLLFDGERLVAAGDLWLDESVQACATSRRRARLVWERGA